MNMNAQDACHIALAAYKDFLDRAQHGIEHENTLDLHERREALADIAQLRRSLATFEQQVTAYYAEQTQDPLVSSILTRMAYRLLKEVTYW